MSLYKVYITPTANREIEASPGFVRQRIKRAIKALRDDPRPPGSKELDVPDIDRELRRLTLDKCRVIYAITETENIVDVFAVRKRPPYDYGDLEKLLAGI